MIRIAVLLRFRRSFHKLEALLEYEHKAVHLVEGVVESGRRKAQHVRLAKVTLKQMTNSNDQYTFCFVLFCFLSSSRE